MYVCIFHDTYHLSTSTNTFSQTIGVSVIVTQHITKQNLGPDLSERLDISLNLDLSLKPDLCLKLDVNLKLDLVQVWTIIDFKTGLKSKN